MKKIILGILALTALAANVNAALILADQFSYTNGPVVLSFGSPWTNHSGGYRQMLVTNEQLMVVGTNNTLFSEDVNATLAGAPYNTNGVPTTNLYASMTINCAALPSAGGGYFAHFKDSPAGFSFRARIFANTTGAAAGKYRIGIGNGSNASTPSPQLAVDLDVNTTYTVVTRYNLMTGQSTLWLNPTNETDTSTDAIDAITSPLPTMSTYAFRQAGNNNGVFLCDDLFVGTLFTDVAGTNHPPFITGIPNQRIAFNTSTPALPFTFGDKETAVGSLILAATSSDTVLVPNANIVITPGGSSGSRFVTVTPAAGQQGVATITISVTDGDSNVSTSVFTVTVGAPSISHTANQETAKNTATAPISFTVSDNESPASSLTMTGDSSNTNLVTTNDIVFGGSGATRTVTITPEPGQTGLSTITLTVSDGTSTTSDSFTLTVYPTDLGVIRCDNFNRANGALVDGTGVWLSYAGTPFATVITNNQVLLTQTITEKVATTLTNTGPSGPSFGSTNGYILYASFNVNFSQLPSSASSNSFAAFKDDTGGTGFINHRARLFVTTSNAAAGNFRLGIANSVATLPITGFIATDRATNKTHFVVVKFNVGTGFSTLWVNPVSQSSPSLDAPDTFNPFILAITTFSFQQDPNHGVCTVDNLRVGGTFADVVSVPSLSAALSGADVKLSWPVTCVDQVLATTAGFSPASWSVVAQSPTVVGVQNVVTITNAAGAAFYRLRD